MNNNNIINNDECSFCLNRIDPSKNYTITNCIHKFHSDCIFKVVQRYNKCPICNRDLIMEIVELDLEAEEDRVSIETEQLLVNNQQNNNWLRIRQLCNCIYKIFIFFRYR
jgi:hypothetical protein